MRVPLKLGIGSIVCVLVGMKIEGKGDPVRVPPIFGENDWEGEKEEEGEPVEVGLALSPETPQAFAWVQEILGAVPPGQYAPTLQISMAVSVQKEPGGAKHELGSTLTKEIAPMEA